MNKNIGLILGAFLLGGILGKSIPVTNTNSNGNTITISNSASEKNENFSKDFKKNENFSKKLNLNTSTLQDFIDAKVGIGESKYQKILDNRPFSSVEELRTKKILGYYAYENNKHRFTVGD
ncbi:MAG: ComEA family DNA-binding protein [Aeromonas sp.]